MTKLYDRINDYYIWNMVNNTIRWTGEWMDTIRPDKMIRKSYKMNGW